MRAHVRSLATMFLLVGLGMVFGHARASEPCPVDSWFSRPKTSRAEWTRKADWVAVGTLVEHRARREPFPNCYLADRSQCEMQDLSTIDVNVTKVVKGTVRQGARLRLIAEDCAPEPPRKLGATYRFFGRDKASYFFFEKVGTDRTNDSPGRPQ